MPRAELKSLLASDEQPTESKELKPEVSTIKKDDSAMVAAKAPQPSRPDKQANSPSMKSGSGSAQKGNLGSVALLFGGGVALAAIGQNYAESDENNNTLVNDSTHMTSQMNLGFSGQMKRGSVSCPNIVRHASSSVHRVFLSE